MSWFSPDIQNGAKKTHTLAGQWGGAARMAIESIINPIVGQSSVNEHTAGQVAIALALLEVAQAIREVGGRDTEK